ncbi:retrovirus-related pol polyprotein from transposon TNT 1-94 [Tanacetum coccineum]
MDVKMAFLNDILREEVRVSQPDGFVDQATKSKSWFTKLREMHSIGYKKTSVLCLYGVKIDLLSKQRPIEKHLHAVKRIFKYLRGTVNRGLWYPKDSSIGLTTYADVDHVGCQDSRRSTSGCMQLLGDRLVSWSSKRQKSTTISSTEAEYIALSGCCAQVLWMRS